MNKGTDKTDPANSFVVQWSVGDSVAEMVGPSGVVVGVDLAENPLAAQLNN